jgi:hypothetical protein
MRVVADATDHPGQDLALEFSVHALVGRPLLIKILAQSSQTGQLREHLLQPSTALRRIGRSSGEFLQVQGDLLNPQELEGDTPVEGDPSHVGSFGHLLGPTSTAGVLPSEGRSTAS